MKAQLRHFALISLLFLAFFAAGQNTLQPANSQPLNNSNPCPGVPGACGYPAASTLSASANQPVSPQNGNGTLGVIYDMSKCGLNFAYASQRLGKRFTPAGITQPAPFVISGVPSCAVIEKAYLWAEGSGNGMAQTATINGPAGTGSFPMTVVGQGPDKCWGYAGSYTYRADVTSIINGNGTYNISGILTNPPTAGNDMDGATLIVIWSQASATWQGRIVIGDGAIVVNGGTSSYNLPLSPAVCGATTNARAFCGIGDIQMAVGSLTLNGTSCPITWNWWNFESVNTTVANGQATSNFTCNTGGDCFNFCVAGLYFRTTTCAVCPTSTAITLNTTSTPASCSSCNGTASVTVAPAGTYTYTWSPAPGTGQGTANAGQLCPGTYTVTVTDACNTATTTVTVGMAGGGITLASAGQTNVACNGQCTGTATVTTSGGTGPYTYAWTPAPGGGQGTSSVTGLCAGTYTCNTTDANGCTGSYTYTITQASPITATTSFTMSTCNQSNGAASVSPSGGTPGYTYSWAPISGSNATLSMIPPNTYTCTITDAALCSYTVSVNVPGVIAPTSTSASTDVTCFGACNGTATVSPTGGTGPYTISWAPSGGNGLTATGLCPGTYTCTVTDANNCVTTSTTIITQPPALVSNNTQVDLLCNAVCNGSASVSMSGGVPGYSYAWSNGGNTSSISSLCAGGYNCQVTDANGCTFSSSFTITEPPLLTLAAAGFNISCFGACDGQLVAIPTGGTPNYAFNWTNACTSASCSNVCPGNYNVTVTDLNGCTATATASVTEPPDIIVTTTTVDAHCNLSDGSAGATFSGGTGNLDPVWYNPQFSGPNYSNIPAGTYSVVVTDDNGCTKTEVVTINNLPGVVATIGTVTNVSCFGLCNGDIANPLPVTGNGPYNYAWTPSVSTSNTASNLCAGTYTYTITDADGCVSSVSTTVTEPTDLTITASGTPNTICAGQTVNMAANAAGGTAAYQYVWMPGPLPQQNATITPPASGTYTVYVSDANGCTDSTTVSLIVETNPVAQLSGDVLSGCDPLCVNFSDMSTISSGTITGWTWDFGDGNTATAQNPSHCYTAPGPYTVTLITTSVAGCANTIVMPSYITVFANPVAAFTAGPQPTTELNPTIYFTDLSVGATNWMWSFGDITNASSTQQNPSFEYPGPGCYDVVLTVTTQDNCVDTTQQQVCIDSDVAIYVPNAFTPNGDGNNETFFPQGVGINPDKFEMWIFDRWGNQIYYTTDYTDGWNGKVQSSSVLCQQDTYVWKIKFVDTNGKKHNLIGHVNLIR
jgi:gliding motility-associated-like protein